MVKSKRHEARPQPNSRIQSHLPPQKMQQSTNTRSRKSASTRINPRDNRNMRHVAHYNQQSSPPATPDPYHPTVPLPTHRSPSPYPIPPKHPDVTNANHQPTISNLTLSSHPQSIAFLAVQSVSPASYRISKRGCRSPSRAHRFSSVGCGADGMYKRSVRSYF